MTLIVPTAKPQSDSVIAQMRHALVTHLHPKTGSPYWIELAQNLGVTADDFESLDDLAIFGPMNEEMLRHLPLNDFIPRSVLASRVGLIPSETGGATGTPKMVVFTPPEFQEGFVDPFVRVADQIGFPHGGRWLFVGPTGPHIIGRAARHLARAMSASEPFTVDFDPRWHRRMVAGSLLQRRHLDHILDQAMRVIARVEITTLFITPSVLQCLLERMSEGQRLAIRGVHLGGQPHTVQDVDGFAQALPNAIMVGGYGNSMVGVCNEVPGAAPGALSYHPASPRHTVRLLDDPETSLTREVNVGDRGRVMFHRLDESFLLINMVERDEATRLPASTLAEGCGLDPNGLGNPGPTASTESHSSNGIY